jgi:prepilin-type N-terminal cleavage/methylation domain-containing protein
MRGLSRRLTAQDGFSLIETLIGAAISVVIASAVAVGLIQNNDSALATQRQTQLVAALQSRIESIHQLLSEDYSKNGFAAIALSSNPAKGKDSTLPHSPGDPNDFITGYEANYEATAGKEPYEGFLIEKNYSNTEQGLVTGATAKGEQLQVDPTNGKIAPESFFDVTTGSSYTSETEVLATKDPYAVVNTYVTLASEDVAQITGNCPTSPGTGSTAGDARRIIIVARLHPANSQASADLMPQYTTTLLTNPTPANQCQHASGITLGLPIP